MKPPIRSIRSAARAVIIYEGRLLTARMRDSHGDYFILPGGGQRPGETLEQTVLRECFEETGVRVEVGALLFVREYIGRNHQFSPKHVGFHQLEHVFRCRILNPMEAVVGHETDNNQIGVTWVPLSDLQHNRVRFYPDCLKQYFTKNDFEVPQVYLGDCN